MRRLVLVLLLLAGCRESPTEPSQDFGATLAGRIVFIESGAPAAGARVIASGTPPTNRRAETLTAADGTYRIEGLIGGSYFIHVHAPGTTETAFLDGLDLFPGQNFFDAKISERRCAIIEGTVRDIHTRRPIAGALLTFGGRSATTLADGFYRLDLGCPPPDAGALHPWKVEHPDYRTLEFPTRVVTYSTVQDVSLTPR